MNPFPRPPYAHIPGRNSRHDPAVFQAVKAATPSETKAASAVDNPAWRFGLELFAEGFYWECHEVLEPVWLGARPNSREREVVQAVIQLANARLKLVMDRPKAAARLAEIAAGHLRAAKSDAVMGIDTESVTAWITQGDWREGPLPLSFRQYIADIGNS